MEKTKIKVSVIVPIYNVENYIKKCLESLVNQTLNELQIILVNDGSKDKSGNIAKEYADKFPEKIIYLEKKNGGLSDARNFGIPYAKGEYIAFLDSDDYIDLNAYETMYNKAIEEDSDLVECNFIWEYDNKIKKDVRIEYSNKKEMLAFIRVVAWNKLIKRKLIVDKNILFPKGLRYEDVEFTYKLLPFVNKVSFVNDFFVHYMQRKDSIANVQNEKTSQIFDILNNVLNFYKENNLYDEYKQELEYNYARYLLCSSLKRMSKIPDKNVRKKLIKESWELLNKTFPEWRKNYLIKHGKGIKNLYLKFIGPFGNILF